MPHRNINQTKDRVALAAGFRAGVLRDDREPRPHRLSGAREGGLPACPLNRMKHGFNEIRRR